MSSYIVSGVHYRMRRVITWKQLLVLDHKSSTFFYYWYTNGLVDMFVCVPHVYVSTTVDSTDHILHGCSIYFLGNRALYYS